MKKTKRLLSAALAVTMTAAALAAGTMSASADGGKLKLLTCSLDADDVGEIGKNIGYISQGDKGTFIHFSAKAAAEWRKTGTLELPMIDVVTEDGSEYDLPGGLYTNTNYNLFGSYYARLTNSDKVPSTFFFDRENKNFVYYQTWFEDRKEFIAPNGNRLVCIEDEDGIREFTLYSSDLSEEIVHIKGRYKFSPFPFGSKYCYFAESGSEKQTVYVMNQNGKMKKISENKFYVAAGVYNGVLLSEDPEPFPVECVYLTTTKKMYSLKNLGKYIDKESGLTYYLSNLLPGIVGTKAVALYECVSDGTIMQKCAFIDIAKDKIIGKVFDKIGTYSSSNDDLLYIKKGDKSGFIDKNGNIKLFADDTSSFRSNSKYAPVIKNGKLFLIDRDFNIVSEKIEVGEDARVYAYPNDFYVVAKEDGKIIIVTYK